MELPHSDPLAANLLPPRHAFESESDDDDPRPREPALVLTADLELVGGQAIPEEATLLVFVGVEGRYFGRGLRGQSGPLATIFTERRQPNAEGIAAEPVARSPVAAIYSIESASTESPLLALYIDDNLPLSAPTPLALTVLESLQPVRIIVVDSYLVSAYVELVGQGSTSSEPPVRFLSTSSMDKPENVLPFAPPNHISASPSPPWLSLVPLSIPSSLLFLLPAPLPTNATVAGLAATLSNILDVELAWNADLAAKAQPVAARSKPRVDTSSMYM